MSKDWFASSIETDKPLIDPGQGRPMLLEVFEFAIKPQPEGTQKPTQQQLFNAHWGHIRTLIWSKGLVANTDVNPRVVIGKKRYRIFILCEPRFNVHGIKTIPGKPKNLNDFLGRVDKKN